MKETQFNKELQIHSFENLFLRKLHNSTSPELIVIVVLIIISKSNSFLIPGKHQTNPMFKVNSQKKIWITEIIILSKLRLKTTVVK